MDFNATTFGQIFFILNLSVIFLTLHFAIKSRSKSLPLVGLYSTILNFILPPLGWYYCFRHYSKQNKIAV
ncbi:hypothetical protein FS418_09225 [Shewanella sp. YLB-09]|uniref:Uncharacterized protein n=1 Tax=Shewanella eurypsychrophilus TaxID=2593656 RepID=A0A550AE10_9GAMM|nr:hypothetical protein FS418_09225 [Shewanella sp. YLB-09]